MSRKVLSTSLLLACGLCVHAQTDTAGVVHHLQEVQVNAARASSETSATVPVQSLRRVDFQALGIDNLADAVKKFAGAGVKDYGGVGGMKTVSLRNLGAPHTAVSYDGVILSNMQAGQIDIGRFSLDNVEQITLSVGQNNTLLQTARHYAAAAVLSVETAKPIFDNPRRTASLRAMLKGGSFGYVAPSLRYWQKAGKRTVVGGDFSYLYADGGYPFMLKNGSMTTREERKNSDVCALQGELNLHHDFVDNGSLHIKTYYYNAQRGLPGSVVLYVNNARERLWDEHFFVQGVFEKPLWRRRLRLKSVIKYGSGWNKYEDYAVHYVGGIQRDVNLQREYYASSTLGMSPLRGLSVALAQDIAVNTLRTNVGLQADPLRLSLLTALKTRFERKRWTAEGTLLSTVMTEHVSVGTQPADRQHLSPMVSLAYRVLAGQQLFVRLMYKDIFRVPTFNELYYLRFGNTHLHPERASEFNCGLTTQIQLSKRVGLQATFDVYRNVVRDKLVAFPTLYVWKMVNFGRVNITGYDATLRLSAQLTKGISAKVLASYSQQEALDKTQKGTYSYNKQLPYTPKHSAHAAIVVQLPWLNIAYAVSTNSERYSMMQQSYEYRLPPFTEHMLTFSRDVKLKGCKLLLSATIQNITDAQYDIIQYYPMPGRSIQCMASFIL